MKTVLQINVDYNAGGSTGKITENIGNLAISNGWESYVAYGRDYKFGQSYTYRINNELDIFEHVLETRLFDNHGLSSRLATKKFINKIDEIKPDIIHLHNIHGYFLNYPILFQYFKKIETPVVWTFHDCWPITGHCFHPIFVPCEGYKHECGHCPRLWEYPNSWFIDRSRKNLQDKKEAFIGVKNLVIVAVSEWLKDVIDDSFMGNYPIKIIHNGIDLNIFSPPEQPNNIKRKYNILFKNFFLGVSNVWSKSKGFDDIIQLSSLLKKDEGIVLVGLKSKEMRNLPKNILGIPHTDNQHDLAALYGEAISLINPTYADNYPTINLESIACGTPVITYNTGGSPEVITPGTGFVVEQEDVKGFSECMRFISAKGRDFYLSTCRKFALENFDKDKCFEKYIELYNALLHYNTF